MTIEEADVSVCITPTLKKSNDDLSKLQNIRPHAAFKACIEILMRSHEKLLMFSSGGRYLGQDTLRRLISDKSSFLCEKIDQCVYPRPLYAL